MIRLTDRLQVLADQIEQNETMADIGTDHGFLPIALWERGISPKVIMADISPGSLDKARENARSLYPEEAFDLRLGSGIRVLEKAEVDAVVLAGMGGALMIHILSEELEKTLSFQKLVLQPRNGQGKLRCWLLANGFSIMRESLVRERKYICEVMTVLPENRLAGRSPISKKMPGCGADSIEYEVPPWIKNAGPLADPFIVQKLSIEENVLRGMLKSKHADEKQLQQVKMRIAYLKTLKEGV
ncbi:MAG: SAM-dependent methyltransferase [Firmicutes bacterium]|nr:SAM-dependent methyltransferase [Bacillota bacterium]